MNFLNSLVIFSASSFLIFGIACFVTEHMRSEFVRYGLTKHLKLVGILQIIGAVGLALGFFCKIDLLTVSSSIGLAVLMLLGFGVRIRIKDPFVKSAPSIIYSAINFYIAIALLLHY